MPRRDEIALTKTLIDVSGVKATDHVIIAGRDHLDMLLGLCRHGVRHAACQAAAGPHDCGPAADVLLVPDFAGDSDLASVLDRLGGELRPDGAIVIHDSHHLTATRANELRRLLARHGFAPTRQPAEIEDGTFLMCARKTPDFAHAQAA
jgi:hypothetical protein